MMYELLSEDLTKDPGSSQLVVKGGGLKTHVLCSLISNNTKHLHAVCMSTLFIP